MTMTMLFWLAFLPLLPISDSLRILVYSPAFAASHTNFLARMADSLTDAGHNVTFFAPVMEESFRNSMGVKKTKDVIVVEKSQEKIEMISITTLMEQFWKLQFTSSNSHRMLESFYLQSVFLCENLLQNKIVLEELKSRDFDIAIAEPIQSCGLALFEWLGIKKVVITSSCVYYDHLIPATGEPEETSYLPSMSAESSDEMTFIERLENYKLFHVLSGAFIEILEAEDQIVKKYLGDNIPGWKELIPAASLHLVNSNPFIDFPRPTIQKTIPIGGISVDMDEIQWSKLSPEWDQILNKRSKNIFISFGSLAQSSAMPDNYRQNILKVIKSQPNVTFIWKYETDDVQFADGTDNVAFVKWAPQTALLNDKRLTAFITHGGLGSTNEVAYLGKPAIMVPIFCDQFRNSLMLAKQGMAIVVPKTDLGNLKTIESAVNSILNDDKFRKNAERVSEMLQNQPHTPKEIAVKHIEFVGKYGPFPLMTPFSLKMPWYSKYNYDVYFFTAITNIVAFALVLSAFKILYVNLPFQYLSMSKKVV